MLNIEMGIQDVCLDVAKKLADLDFVIEISLKKENFIPYINAPSWGAISLSHGYPGLICLFSEMEHFFPDQVWEKVIHECVQRLVKEIENHGANATLFSGITGISFAIQLASHGGRRYRKLLSKLHDFLLEKIKAEYVNPILESRKKGGPISPFLYDVITGISGVLPYLFQWTKEDKSRALLRELLHALVQWTDLIPWQDCEIPGWFILADYLFREEDRSQYEKGCFDTGIAHGIAGGLSALARASLLGISVQGQIKALRRIILWLKQCRQDIGEYQNVWPGRLGFHSSNEHYLTLVTDYYRDGWCYGAPGIAFSLFLAGQALCDTSLCEYAIATLEETCVRLFTQQTLFCPSFCHGWAGALAIIHQMYLATEKTIFAQTARKIAKEILNHYNPDLPFGFKCLAAVPSEGDIVIDNAGLLDGSTGVILSLLFYQLDRPRPWLPLFML